MDVFASEFKLMLAKNLAKPFGSLLLKWGFLDSSDLKSLSKYLANASIAMVKSIFETRKQMEMDKLGSSNSGRSMN